MKKLFRPISLGWRTSTGLLVLRVVAGLAFMHHGYGKIQNPTGWMGDNASIPGFFQALAAISEFGGGLAWILGLLTPLASLGIGCTMVMAVRLHALVLHDPFVAKGPGSGSYELAAIYLCAAILFLLSGPGGFSLDRLIFGEKTRRKDSATAPATG